MENNSPVRILAIESSCDETAAAIIENGEIILSNVVASQMEIHARYGGVFPEVASRQHVLSILPVVKQCLSEAHLSLDNIDAIAVTSGPGLAGSLVVGLNAAKGLAIGAEKPLIGVNHLEGHIYSSMLRQIDTQRSSDVVFPMIALLVSGGHTEIILMKDHLDFEKLGSTLDDAAGEAFDKTARLIGLPYPGGPSIENISPDGDEQRFTFPKARTDGIYDFSFSGLKTAVLREVRDFEKKEIEIPKADLAASFQRAVVETLVSKTIAAAVEHNVTTILVAGGVSANKRLRLEFEKRTGYEVIFPPFEFCTDNAAMVGAAGYQRFVQGKISRLDIDVEPTWSIT